MALNAKLVVIGGDVKTTEINLKLPATIGRGRGASIVLPHPLVSRQHCELFEAAGQLMVRDLGSLNGTFINNQRITESPLPAGQLLTIGTVTFRAVYEGEAAAISPSAATLVDPGDKTVQISKTRTVAAPSKAGAATEASDEELEYNFDEPLLPSEAANSLPPADAAQPTERLQQTISDKGRAKAADASAKTERKSAPKSPPPREPEMTVDFDRGAPDDEVTEQADADSDDGLDDFLKGLQK